MNKTVLSLKKNKSTAILIKRCLAFSEKINWNDLSKGGIVSSHFRKGEIWIQISHIGFPLSLFFNSAFLCDGFLLRPCPPLVGKDGTLQLWSDKPTYQLSSFRHREFLFLREPTKGPEQVLTGLLGSCDDPRAISVWPDFEWPGRGHTSSLDIWSFY